MSFIVLFLLANEDKTHLRIVHNELYLLFATGCIEWNRYSTNAIRTEVGVEILQTILRENSYILLRFHTKVEQGITHLFYTQREMIPRNGSPFVRTKVFRCQCGCVAILASLLVNEQ